MSDEPAAGGYRRLELLPRKGRSRSASPTSQLPGCIPTWGHDFEAAGTGTPVSRRLRSNSPKTQDALKGSISLGASPRHHHNAHRAFAFDADVQSGGARSRNVRRVVARNLASSWSLGEAPPEASVPIPAPFRSVSPETLTVEEAPPSRRLKATAPQMRFGGMSSPHKRGVPIQASLPPPPYASPRQSSDEAARAMEMAKPIMWFGEARERPVESAESW
ncbi:unnamed protein product, partial [Effrenium voratum]